SSRRRHTRWPRDWSSDVCSSDLARFAIQHHVVIWSGVIGAFSKLHPAPDVFSGYTTRIERNDGNFLGFSRSKGNANRGLLARSKIGRASCREGVWIAGVAAGGAE